MMTISWVVLIYANKARKTSGYKKEMPDVFFFTEKWVNFALSLIKQKRNDLFY